jgi:hypothetical protein
MKHIGKWCMILSFTLVLATGCSLRTDPVKDWKQIDIAESKNSSSASPLLIGSITTKEQFQKFMNAIQTAVKIEGTLSLARSSDYDFTVITNNNGKHIYQIWVKDQSSMYIDMGQGTGTGYTMTPQGKEAILSLLREAGAETADSKGSQVKATELAGAILANEPIANESMKGKKLQLRMIEGTYVEEKEPGPFMGWNWRGKFQLELLGEQDKLISSFDVNKAFQGEPLNFQKKFSIRFDDYNDDGNPDFAIGQYASSNLYVYSLFTIKSGEIELLPIKGVSDLFSSQREYSILFDKVNAGIFKTVFYDNSKGHDVQQFFAWKGDGFEFQQDAQKLQELQSLEADLSGNGHRSKLDLSVLLDENSNPLAWILKVDGKETIKLPPAEEGLFGSRAELKQEDIDHSGTPKVLIFRRSTGTGGATGLNIYNPADSWKEIFAIQTGSEIGGSWGTNAERFEVKYLGNFKVSFKDIQAGLRATIPLNAKTYESMDADQVKRWLTELTAWVDPISDYNIQDLDGDGVKEIVAVQRVIGISHPDTIALLKTTYKLQKGIYVKQKESIYNGEGSKLLGSVRVK